MESFAIIDDNGIIHQSSHKEDMEIAFNAMQENQSYFSEQDYPESSYDEFVSKYKTDWEGDLNFVEVIDCAY